MAKKGKRLATNAEVAEVVVALATVAGQMAAVRATAPEVLPGPEPTINERVAGLQQDPAAIRRVRYEREAVLVSAKAGSIRLGGEQEDFLREARAVLSVLSAGNAVSPDALKALVSRAVGLLG